MILHQIQRAIVCACAIALMGSGNTGAQTSPSETWPRRGPAWPRLDQSDPAYWKLGNEPAGERQPTSGVRTPLYPTVTLHELAHHVPRRAANEYGRALKAKHKGQNEDAIAHFRNAISLDPEFSAAINDLGTTYLKLNKINLAVEQFSKAITVDPHSALPCSNLAIAYLRKNQYRDAERTARQAVDLDPADTHGLLVLGVSLVLGGRFNGEAERLLTRASVEFGMAKLWLGVGLIQRGNIAEARDQLKAYLADPDKNGVEIATGLLHQLESAKGPQVEVAQMRPKY